MLLKLLLAMLMALITAVMAQEEFENPASDRPHVPRPWNDDMAAVNLYDDNGCSGHEFTLNVIYGVEEGCWNVNNVQSLSAIENGCWTKTYSGRDCQIDDCTFRVPEPACFNRAPKSIRIKCERNRNQMLDDPIFQSNAGDNYKGLGNPLDDHGPGQPSGNFPSEPPPGTPGVQVWRSFPFPFTRTHKRRGKDSRPPLRRDGLWDDIDWKDSRPHAQVDGITKDWRMHYCYEAPPGPPDEEGEPQEPPQERPPDPQRL